MCWPSGVSGVTIVGATSGDTGSAAIEACRDRDTIDIFILHPHGRVSEVQRRQMTTVTAPNVHNLAVEGTFDDCQDLVKALFADAEFRERRRLSAVNSINWARVMAQVVYYARPWPAWAVGPIGRSRSRCPRATSATSSPARGPSGWACPSVGSSWPRTATTSSPGSSRPGRWTIGDVHPTLSPSMDIQVSSNLERLLFELYGRDGAAVAELMARFRADGHRGDRRRIGSICSPSSGRRRASTTTRRWPPSRGLRAPRARSLDPHTAVGLAAARIAPGRRDRAHGVLATAHPAKFPDAVEAATGVRPALPARLADLFERPERLRDRRRRLLDDQVGHRHHARVTHRRRVAPGGTDQVGLSHHRGHEVRGVCSRRLCRRTSGRARRPHAARGRRHAAPRRPRRPW